MVELVLGDWTAEAVLDSESKARYPLALESLARLFELQMVELCHRPMREYLEVRLLSEIHT